MAESQSMTSAGVVAKALIEEHSDFLRESVAMVASQIMEAEIARQIGAGKGEVTEARSTHRNGYRQRPWQPGWEIELAVPRKRSGESYFPSFLKPRKRSEKALLGVVMEAYVNGVSTRKVDHLVSELGIQMSRERQQGDRPALGRRRHLSQRQLGDPSGRDALDRAKRRVAAHPRLSLPGVDRPGPRGPGRRERKRGCGSGELR